MPHIPAEDTQVNLRQQSFLCDGLLLLHALQKPLGLSTENSSADHVLNQDHVYFYNVDPYVKNALTVLDKVSFTPVQKNIVHKLKFYLFKSKWFLLIKSKL